MRVAGGVFRHRDEAGHAAAALIFRAHRMAGAFRRHHGTSRSSRGSIRLKWMLRPCANSSAAPSLEIGREMLAVDVALQFVGGQHHHDIGPFGGVGDVL